MLHACMAGRGRTSALARLFMVLVGLCGLFFLPVCHKTTKYIYIYMWWHRASSLEQAVDNASIIY